MTKAVAIHEKFLLRKLKCSFGLGNKITDKDLTDELNQSKNSQELEAKKPRFPGESGKYLKALKSELAKFSQYDAKLTMYSGDRGDALLPVAFLLDYLNEYNNAQTRVEAAYQEFEDNYDWALQQAQASLNGTFNLDDYPSKQDLSRYLHFKMRTLTLPHVDNDLLDIVGQSVQSDVDIYLNETMQEGLKDVNMRIRDALERMVKQLGNPKGKIYDSLTSSLLELVSYIPSFNVVEDDSLNLLAKEIQNKLLVHNTEALHDPAVRQNVAAEAAEILRRMG